MGGLFVVICKEGGSLMVKVGELLCDFCAAHISLQNRSCGNSALLLYLSVQTKNGTNDSNRTKDHVWRKNKDDVGGATCLSSN